MSDEHIENLTSKVESTFELLPAAIAQADSSKVQSTDGDHEDISLGQIGEESDSGEESTDSNTVCKNWHNIRRNRDIVYSIIRGLHQASRYLETYFRYDDILTILPDLENKLEISIFYISMNKLFNDMKIILLSDSLPATEFYRSQIELIFANLRAARVNIDPETLEINSQKIKRC
jgi:hypothetical protein